jgi:hypothetical protein
MGCTVVVKRDNRKVPFSRWHGLASSVCNPLKDVSDRSIAEELGICEIADAGLARNLG